MRIRALSVHLLAVPLEPPIRGDRFDIPAIYHPVVALHSDEGHTGLGYGLLLDRRHGKPLAALLASLEEVVVGLDPTMPEAVWRATSEAVYLAGPSGLATMAISAVDIAVWDLFGQIAGQPLWRLLGGARPEVPAYTTGALRGADPDELARQAVALVERGETAMKLGAGGSPREIVRRVAAIRRTVGPDVQLMLDNVESWRPEEAIRLGRMLEEYDLTWFEDPVHHLDYSGMAKVAAALDTPVCSGESLYGLDGFRPLIASACADIVMIDVRRAGGITPFRKIAGIAEAWHLPAVPHFMPEITAHLVAALPNSPIAEYVPWSAPLFQEPLRPAQGRIRLPDRPGLGLVLAPGALERYAV